MEDWKLAVIQRENKRIKVYRRLLVAVTFILFSVMFTLTYMQAYNSVPKQIRLIQGDWQQWDFRLPVKGTITRLEGEEALRQGTEETLRQGTEETLRQGTEEALRQGTEEALRQDSAKRKQGERGSENRGLEVFEQGQDVVDSLQVSGQRPSNIPADSISIDLSKEISIKAEAMETYQMDLKLFGVIPFKQVEIQVMQDQMVVPAGIPIGIYIKTEGVLVVGTGDFEGEEGVECNPCEFVLKSGDYILEVDGEEIEYKHQLIDCVEESEGEKMNLKIARGEEELLVSVTPKKNKSGDYKLGIWVRDNAQGVGTLTFVDEQGNFGALGHGISDVDTGEVLDLKSGTLYSTEIIALKKGKSGEPGEMTGMIEYIDSNIWGKIEENSDKGIYGEGNEKLLNQVESQALPIGLKHEIQKGPAQIICSVEGEPKYYDIKIKDIYLENAHVNRGILLEVTDPELLAVTGGIIQGMSGAPIVQNGKLIGAVTHVLVQDSTSGYGIFIETMLEEIG